MKRSSIKPIIKTSLNLLLICALISCGEDDLEPLDDCEQGMDTYLTKMEIIPDEIDLVQCPSGRINSTQEGKLQYFSQTFSPHDDHRIVYIKKHIVSETETYNELVLFDFCTGKETILDTADNLFYQAIQWTKTDWIYFGKIHTHKYFKVRPNGDSLQEVEIPGGISRLTWNNAGTKIAYIRELPSGRLIIIADESIIPIDTIHGFERTGLFDFTSNNKLVFSYQDDNETKGIFQYNFETKSASLLSQIDKLDGVLALEASEDNDEIYWETNDGIYRVDANSGITNQIIKSNRLIFHIGASQSPSTDYLLTTRVNTTLISDCNYLSETSLAIIDLNTNTIEKIEFDE